MILISLSNPTSTWDSGVSRKLVDVLQPIAEWHVTIFPSYVHPEQQGLGYFNAYSPEN